MYGWTIPVTSLRFWALGIPDPASPAETEFGDDGQLRKLIINEFDIGTRKMVSICVYDGLPMAAGDIVEYEGKIDLIVSDLVMPRRRDSLFRWRIRAPRSR